MAKYLKRKTKEAADEKLAQRAIEALRGDGSTVVERPDGTVEVRKGEGHWTIHKSTLASLVISNFERALQGQIPPLDGSRLEQKGTLNSP